MEKIYVSNTLTGQKEIFEPREPGKVSMYVCGMTVQDFPHLGHARCYITFDIVKRYLTHKGYKVDHIQNYTDIDDKIIAKAQKEGISTGEVAAKYTEAYKKDMAELNIEPAGNYPLATEHIPEIIEMIVKLIEKGFAYEVDGDVYYEVRKKTDYGKLSKRTLDDMRAGERVEVDPRKKDPMDFALWKSSKAGEPAWESPWGPGRPGWHIECSAMSLRYLRMSFDIHGGGQDLIFPHHENEIAQSEAFAGTAPFVRYWLHNGFINLNHEKMSKSTGNFVYLYQILEKYNGQIVRLFILGTHYKSPVDFTEDGLVAAQSSLEGLLSASRDTYSLMPGSGQTKASDREKLTSIMKKTAADFEASMSDDFNTPSAIAALYELKDGINIFYKAIKSDPAKEDVETIHQARQQLIDLGSILGLDLDARAKIVATERVRDFSPDHFEELTEKLPSPIKQKELDDHATEEAVENIIEMRLGARKLKDFETSDLIRDRMLTKGVALEDTPQGTKYYSVTR